MIETMTRPQSVPRLEHREGTVARTIEEQTAKLPSDLFLWAAGASIVGSLLLQCVDRRLSAAPVQRPAAREPVHRPVGAHAADPGALQQARQGRRLRPGGSQRLVTAIHGSEPGCD